MSTIKYMPAAEFRALGYLQELNRGFLHPHGLALEVIVEDDGTEKLGGIWDYREDAEGIAFGEGMIDPEQIRSVRAELEKHRSAREAMFGSVIQPAPDEATT